MSDRTTPIQNYNQWTLAGAGLGLRQGHYRDFLQHKPGLSWLEILSDLHVDMLGPEMRLLEQIRCFSPLSLHGSRMSLGSAEPLNYRYLKQLKQLAIRLESSCISDHIAFSSLDGQFSQTLLPLPLTEEALDHLVPRIQEVQDYLGQQILLKNPACYFRYTHSTLSEGEFMAALAQRADCLLILDLSNSYINQYNLGRNALDCFDQLPASRIRQIHLSGFTDCSRYLTASRDCKPQDAVLALYEAALEQFGPVPVALEWDYNLPLLHTLVQEVHMLEQLMVGRQRKMRASR
ncbi:DUF692 domain-containing protein [Marinobacterium jannaschii]|uniref:DUF692 domain-containing protein n=1 Tax=Marinobacterium jannaschii TaxID=64970 RepID=UPI0006874358|nr:DUF692 domain-containing protein [Marinobacterium jannaschii]